MPTFAEILQEAPKVASYRADIEKHITELMNNGTLIKVAREGQTSYILREYEWDFLEKPASLAAAKELVDAPQPSFGGFCFRLLRITPQFVMDAQENGSKKQIFRNDGCGVRPGTVKDAYDVLMISW